MVYSRAERVFIPEHYFAPKPFADKEVSNTTIHRLLTKFRDTGCVSGRKHVRRRTVLTGETLRNVEETQKTQLVCRVIVMSLKLTNTVVVRVAF
jgi:hypothetical protein